MNETKEILTEDELMDEYVESLLRLPRPGSVLSVLERSWSMTGRLLDCVEQRLYW